MSLATASRCFLVSTNSCSFCFTSEDAIAPGDTTSWTWLVSDVVAKSLEPCHYQSNRCWHRSSATLGRRVIWNRVVHHPGTKKRGTTVAARIMIRTATCWSWAQSPNRSATSPLNIAQNPIFPLSFFLRGDPKRRRWLVSVLSPANHLGLYPGCPKRRC